MGIGRAVVARPKKCLLVDACACLFETLKDVVQIVREHHELLQAFHADTCHFSSEVTVEKLRDVSADVKADLVILHVAGTTYESARQRKNLILALFTGRKRNF